MKFRQPPQNGVWIVVVCEECGNTASVRPFYLYIYILICSFILILILIKLRLYTFAALVGCGLLASAVLATQYAHQKQGCHVGRQNTRHVNLCMYKVVAYTL